MSKIIFFVSLFVVYVHSGPASKDREAEIIKYEYKPSVGDSGYRFEYETSDHQSKIEDGVINNGTLRVNGTYTYIDTDGGTHTIKYLSDEHGFSSQNIDVPAVGTNREAKNLVEVDTKPKPVVTARIAAPTVAAPTTVAARTTEARTTAATTTAARTTAATTTAAPSTAAASTAAVSTAATTTTTRTSSAPPAPAVILP